MRFKEITEGLRDPKDNPCWKGYKPVGTKKKNGRIVPNCVPKESVAEADLVVRGFGGPAPKEGDWVKGKIDTPYEGRLGQIEKIDPTRNVMRMGPEAEVWWKSAARSEWVPVKWLAKIGGSRFAEGVAEDKQVDPITSTVLNFYKPIVGDIQKERLPDYVDQVKELLQQHRPEPSIQRKLMDIFKKGKENPYIQGGIVTTVGAVLAGGVLNTAQQLGLSPAQTNLALQAILNTVIPTVVSRINGKNWKDTIKYTLSSAGIGTGIAAASLSERSVAEGRAGIDDTDTVGFSVNSEAAYNAVMKRFGNYIDHDETSGVMYAPARVWPQIEMAAFDADPDEGAVRVEDDVMEESSVTKSIKRGLQGWGSPQDKPADIVKRNKAYDVDTAKKVRAGLDNAPEHTPAGLQKRVLDRKLKGVAEGNGLNTYVIIYKNEQNQTKQQKVQSSSASRAQDKFEKKYPNCRVIGLKDWEQGIAETAEQFYAIVNKVNNKVLSTHRDLESAKDEWRGLDKDQRPFYRVATTKKKPEDWKKD